MSGQISLLSLSYKKSFKLTLFITAIILQFETSFCDWKVWDKELEWWQKSTVYQIYPRSFQDSDGDGIGDLKGIISRINHFKETGIDTIWLSPIFKSPMVDLGYDISDYEDIDPLFGTLDDFKTLKNELKARGMYLLTDFVPNHTSDQHEWFQKSVKSEGPYKDYYVWRDGRKLENGSTTYPNNWISFFGGHAWEYNEERGQYYYHGFDKKQPELNFYNPLVREEMKKILKFWLDLGVDGFRVDAVSRLTEDPEYNDEPCLQQFEGVCGNDYRKINHSITIDWPATYDIVIEWRQFLDEYTQNASEKHTRILLTEAYGRLDNIIRYYGNETHAGAQLPFNFILVITGTDLKASDYVYYINLWMNRIPEGCWLNWVTGNHDNKRIASKVGNEMVDAFFMMSMLFPGTAVTYQGEEIGQPDNTVRSDQIRDTNIAGVFPLRDPERGPFLWDDTENAGFTTAKIPWQPIHPSYWQLNLEAQKKASKSHYKIYKQMVDLRKTDTIQRGDLLIKNISTWVLAFTRRLPGNETYIVLINLGSEMETVYLREELPDIPYSLNVVASSINSGYDDGEQINTKAWLQLPTKPLVLRPKASVVLTTNYQQPGGSTKGQQKSKATHSTNVNKMLLFSVIISVCAITKHL